MRIERLTGAVDAGENSVTGTLTDVIYLGNARRCIVRLPSGQEVIIMQQGGSRLTTERGRTVQLSWGAEDALALPC